jgi:spore coat protein A, manganese oxidase
MKNKKLNPPLTRRQVLKAGLFAGAGMMTPWRFLPAKAFAAMAAPGLSDPALQPKFTNTVPNALDPGFKYSPYAPNRYLIGVGPAWQKTGLVNRRGRQAWTKVYGYGQRLNYTWPGMTFEVQRSDRPVIVWWRNQLWGQKKHILPVDTNLHWAFSLHGYEKYSIRKNGIPIITHLHGGHTDFQFDGNPEWFYTPGNFVRGPSWKNEGIPFTTRFRYDVDVPAGPLWYHDHALGITRLNVYAGLAGFFFVRDDYDTGQPGNPLDLPAFPYEMALAIQDRMFKANGRLFYPAFPGDPFYEDFIIGEEADLPPELFPNGGPTALAEFFGDHMVVNGLIWPKAQVEPRNYRLRLLNGCDSRFLAVQFFEVPAGATDFTTATGPLSFDVIGSDQGLASEPKTVDTLLMETGSRYDVIVDFATVTPGSRIIMKNIGGDEPFGGDIPGPQVFGETDRIMAFDVVLPFIASVPDANPTGISFGPNVGAPTRIRKVALFEGKDEFGRLQPLLGTAEPATDFQNPAQPVNWPATPEYQQATLPDGTSSPLRGQMEGSIAWHSPTTENPALDTTEEWEIWNATGDAHPVHLHLVHFEILGREEIFWDSATGDGESDYGRVADPIGMPGSPAPVGDGTYLVVQPTVQHNSVAGDASTYGMGFKIMNKTYGGVVDPPFKPEAYVENTAKDMVTALPGQITRIKATFDKPGRYVWHCHILSHEDHEMMRILYVGPGA